MRVIICVLLLFGLWVFPANAQQFSSPSPTGPLEAILIEGSNDEVLDGRIRVAIDVEPGNLVENIQVDRLREQVLELGLFREARVELQVRDGKNSLLITVRVNPKIASVEMIAKDIDIAAVKTQLLENQLNIAPGVLLDNARLEEGRSKIGQVFRQYIYPFTPNVKLEVSEPDSDDTVKVTYSVDASANVKSIRVSGATLINVAEIEESFKRLLDKVSFDAQLYGAAVQRVSSLYAKLGYRGSGVSQASSELTDGVLNIEINELKVVAIDATQLGVAPESLALQVGDLFNYEKLLANVRELNKSRDKQVGLKLEQPSEDSMIVTITLEDALAGPITEIKFEGNTLISKQKLLERLRQRLGDTFNVIASQEDVSALSSAYTAAGFALAGAPEVTFLEGVYQIKLLEARVVAYEINWQNPAHRTQDAVILRELPGPGLLRPGPYSVAVIQKALQRINALEIIDPSSLGNITTRVVNPEKPEEIIVILNLQEAGTILLEPNIAYSSRPGDGWSGAIKLSETNLFGLGNRLSLGFTTQPNPNATAWYDNFSGNVSYTIPWVDLDFLDFKTVRTTINFSISSSINQAQAIPGQDTGANAKPVGSEYRTFSTRTNGFGLSIGRPIAENLTLRFGISYSYQANSLERGDLAKLNPNLKDDALAQALLATQAPDSSTLTTFSEITYSTRNDLNFPTGGSTVQASASYSFGTEGFQEGIQGGTRALNWSQFTLGYSTYLGFGFDQNGRFEVTENRNMALAFRINGGAQLGDAPRNSQFRIGDAGNGNEAFVLRGYSNGDLRGDVYYSGSLEYRYDFGLKTAFTNALIGVAFVDAANAWGNTGPRPFGVGDGLQFGYGLGAQINLQLGAFTLPPLGFYYAWSPSNPSGRFHFVFSFRF